MRLKLMSCALIGVLGAAGCASERATTSSTPRTTTGARASHVDPAKRAASLPKRTTTKGSDLTMTCCSGGEKVVYAGLGAPNATFVADNEQEPPNPAGAPPGIAWYTVDSTNALGRVTAYTVTENAQPPMSSRERMVLAVGLMLPDDARMANGYSTVLNNDTCIVWESRKLRLMTGMRFAAVTTSSDTDTAQARAEPSAGC